MEKAGITVQCFSLGQSNHSCHKTNSTLGTPWRRLCVDYQALINLLLLVTKAYSKANGVFTLLPMPKIYEMYAKLVSSSIYSTLDLRSGYYHTALSADFQRKSAFVTPMGKFEFQKVPFGLAQALPYLQWLINEALSSFYFFWIFR